MKTTALKRIGRDIAILAAATGLGGLTLALAGDRTPPIPVHYAGLINDFTTSTVKNGPYVMNGKWMLDLDQRRGTSRFTAELNMETSDFGVTSGGTINPENPTSRGAHTHHILMTDGTFSTDISACPALTPALPAATGGFTITGSVYITVNGGPTPFANPSPMTLCVLGGELVQFSNLTLVMSPPASGHFGTFPIHGVIVRCARPWDFNSKDCTEIPD